MTGDAPRQGNRLADAAGGVTDEVGADAAKHYDEEQFAALVSLIGLQRPGRHHPAARRRLPARPVRITRILLRKERHELSA